MFSDILSSKERLVVAREDQKLEGDWTNTVSIRFKWTN